MDCPSDSPLVIPLLKPLLGLFLIIGVLPLLLLLVVKFLKLCVLELILVILLPLVHCLDWIVHPRTLRVSHHTWTVSHYPI